MNLLDKVKSLFGFLPGEEIKERTVVLVEEELTDLVEKEAKNAEDGLSSMTVAQLRDKAKSLGMKGYTGLRKSDLIDAVRENL